LLLAETVEAKREFVVHLIVDGAGNHDVTAYMIAPQTAKRMRHRIWRHSPLRAAFGSLGHADALVFITV
jgi:hypothetical protein